MHSLKNSSKNISSKRQKLVFWRTLSLIMTGTKEMCQFMQAISIRWWRKQWSIKKSKKRIKNWKNCCKINSKILKKLEIKHKKLWKFLEKSLILWSSKCRGRLIKKIKIKSHIRPWKNKKTLMAEFPINFENLKNILIFHANNEGTDWWKMK